MDKIKTVVIPIAGMGTRFLPVTKALSKEMLNLLDRPLIDYAVTEAKEAGIKNFIFITSSTNKLTEKYFSNNTELNKLLKKQNKKKILNNLDALTIKKKNIRFVMQDKPLGLGDAILKTEKFIKEKNFAVILPDDLILGFNCTKQLINLFEKKSCNILGIMEVNKLDVNKYGIIDYEKKSKNAIKIKGLIEKPDINNAPSNFAIVGRYIFKNTIFRYLKKIKLGKGREYQLTDAISLSNKDNDVWGYKFKGNRFDCGSKLGLLKAQITVALKDKEIKNDVRKFIKNLGDEV